jgi:hypothetical protein
VWARSPPGSTGDGDLEVRGRAGDFFLRLWGRDVKASFTGDVEVLDEWADLAKGMG